MNTFSTLKVKQEGRILTVTLNRPDSQSFINITMVHELTEMAKMVSDSSDLSVVIIKGRSDVFCTGVDLTDFTPDKEPDIYGFQKWEKMCSILNMVDKLIITAIRGDCFGGGFDLLLLGDIRIAEKKAFFRLNDIKMGILPGMTTIYRLAKNIGLGRAKSLILTNKALSADKALDWGLVDRVCDVHEMDEVIRQSIDEMMPLHPVPLLLSRRLLMECFSDSHDDFIGHYLAAQHRCINSEDFKKLIEKAKEANLSRSDQQDDLHGDP